MVRPLLLAALALTACGPIAFSTTLTGSATIPGGNPTQMLAALPLLGQLANLDFDSNADFTVRGVTRADLVLAKAQAAHLS